MCIYHLGIITPEIALLKAQESPYVQPLLVVIVVQVRKHQMRWFHVSSLL